MDMPIPYPMYTMRTMRTIRTKRTFCLWFTHPPIQNRITPTECRPADTVHHCWPLQATLRDQDGRRVRGHYGRRPYLPGARARDVRMGGRVT